jgi:SRSO17 transposase
MINNLVNFRELRRLQEYASLFRDDFPRCDQARWAEVYMQGLLSSSRRKNIETLAQHVAMPRDRLVADAAQALQNFLNQSPWDEQRPWKRFRELMADRYAHPDGILAVDDLTFLKQGRHSVGVQRQYSTALGRKVNCQIAVGLHYLSPRGDCPLAMRLYLPQAWLRQPQRLDLAGVPANFRTVATKGQIALELLDQVRAEGIPARYLIAGSSYGASQEFREALSERALDYVVGVLENQAGPGEFLLEGQGEGKIDYALARPALTLSRPQAERLWQGRHVVARAYQRMRDDLGLDHFEGRSWRGFHHHLCLVTLAYGFLALAT